MIGSTRFDPTTGIREVAEFFVCGNLRVFGFRHLPASDAKGAVVICSPLYAEFVRNYRREVLVGRRLAELGIGVQRFHYRGSGNSEGKPESLTFDKMCEDAVVATERLQATAGVARVAFFGTRLGSIVAAAVGRRFPQAPIAMWDPVVDVDQYIHDISRAMSLRALRTGGEAESSSLMTRLSREGRAEALGYSIPRSLYDSARGHDLGAKIDGVPRPLLVLQLGRDRQSVQLGDLIAGWEGAGFDIASRTVGQREAWWFTAGAVIARESLEVPVDITVAWFDSRLSEKTDDDIAGNE